MTEAVEGGGLGEVDLADGSLEGALHRSLVEMMAALLARLTVSPSAARRENE